MRAYGAGLGPATVPGTLKRAHFTGRDQRLLCSSFLGLLWFLVGRASIFIKKRNHTGGSGHMGGCQNHYPFLGTLNIRCRIIIWIQKRNYTGGSGYIFYSSTNLGGHPPLLLLRFPETPKLYVTLYNSI